jgi:pimeloyl-ACP methyl ester carboxylesterase
VYLRDQIVGARLHLIDGAGHMIQIERPQAVARALSDWVEKL